MFFKQKEKLDIGLLKNEFGAQAKMLMAKGYPALLGMDEKTFTENLSALWKSFAEKAGDLKMEVKGNIPLLLVVEKGDMQEKMKKMNGHTGLDFGKIKQNSRAGGNSFYILLDVEDGANMVAKSPKDALKKFGKEKRSALNLLESIALLTLRPEILKNHYLISAGSFYDKEGRDEPLLWLMDEDHHPELHYAWFDIAHGSYGTASYAIKI